MTPIRYVTLHLIIELINIKQSLEGKITAYEQLICYSEDIQSLVDNQRENITFLQTEKSKLETALEASLKHIENTERINYDLTKKVENLLIIINGKGGNQFVKTDLSNIKTKSYIYLPVEGDPIDARLAEDLNSYQDPKSLSELFARESSGIYKFGTKRIFVKLENGKVISKLSFKQ